MNDQPHLTDRQITILTMLMLDYSRKQIGKKLGIRRGTVQYHIDKAKKVIGVRGTEALITKTQFLLSGNFLTAADNDCEAPSSECAASPSLAAGSSELAGTRTKVNN